MPLSSSDELEIIRLLNRYAQGASSHDLDSLVSLFVEDGIWERLVGASSGKWTENVRVQGEKEFRAFSVKSFEMQGDTQYQYLVANPVVTGDGDTASGISTLVVLGLDQKSVSVILIGHFEDKYLRTVDGWKFAYRGMRVST